MAEAKEFVVRAILEAKDKNFKKAMQDAGSATQSLGQRLKSGLGFGFLMSAGQSAFNALVSGAKSLISETNSANKAWKTFEANMVNLGRSSKDIAAVKEELQQFATETIYSSSDMAQTFAQLEAVGVKNTTRLVKGFGGLAAAAENPAQAMKTLSTQATQMAARPAVAWQDFKLMLEQTPAGIAAVAKHMGKTTAQLVADVQAGTVSTEEFFEAIEKVGNSDAFQKMATSYKGVDDAIDGLKESCANKLGPAFEVASSKICGYIERIIDWVGKIDADKLADRVGKAFEAAEPYIEMFGDALSVVCSILSNVGGFLLDNSDTIANLIPVVLGLVGGYKAMKVVSEASSWINGFTGSVKKLKGSGLDKTTEALEETADATSQVGSASANSTGSIKDVGLALLEMGGAVLLISAGFWLLADAATKVAESGGAAIAVLFGLVGAVAAIGFGMVMVLKTLAPMAEEVMPAALAMLVFSVAVAIVAGAFWLMSDAAVSLADSGGAAIAVFFGMVVAIAALMLVAALLGPMLEAGALGLLAFGLAALMVGVAVWLICEGIAAVIDSFAGLCEQLPIVAQYGDQAATAFMMLGAGLLIFGVGAIVGAVGAILLGVALIVLAAGALVAAVAIAAFGGAMLIAALGIDQVANSVMKIANGLMMIGSGAMAAAGPLMMLAGAVEPAISGLNRLKSTATTSMSGVKQAFSQAAQQASNQATQLANNYCSSLQSGLSKAPNVSKSAVEKVITVLNTGGSQAFNAGMFIGQGFADGMMSMLGSIEAAAERMVSAADKAVTAKARIGSPSKLFATEGGFVGEGFANGILDMLPMIRRAAEAMVAVPDVSAPGYGYDGGLDGDASYYPVVYVDAHVTSELDGREVGYGTARYVQQKNDFDSRRANRLSGVVL